MNKVMFYIKQKIWQYKKYKLRLKKIKMSQLKKSNLINTDLKA